MLKSTLYMIITVLFVLGVSAKACALTRSNSAVSQELAQAESAEKMHMEQETVTEAAPQAAVDAGNKICPVSQEKIDENLKATYEYEGKIYNFCCAACIEEFKKDPQEYIKKVEEELKDKSSVTEEEIGHMHEEHAH
jgi:YHS domain-containing protein